MDEATRREYANGKVIEGVLIKAGIDTLGSPGMSPREAAVEAADRGWLSPKSVEILRRIGALSGTAINLQAEDGHAD